MNAHMGCFLALNTFTSSCTLPTGEQSHSFKGGEVIVQNKRSRKLQNQTPCEDQLMTDPCEKVLL